MTAGGAPAPPLFEVRGPMADPRAPRTLPGVARVYFAHLSTRIILASLLPLLAARVWLGGWTGRDLGIVAVAVVAWPFFEWVFHVVIHLRPVRLGRFTLDTVAAREHRLHHVDPTVVDHTLLPPSALVVMAALSAVGFPLLLGPRPGLTAAICFHLGGLANGWVHLLTHMPYAPRSRFFRWVRRTHTLHHFKNERYWMAFTGPFVDVLMGSWRDPAEVATSAACVGRGREGPAPSGPADPEGRPPGRPAAAGQAE